MTHIIFVKDHYEFEESFHYFQENKIQAVKWLAEFNATYKRECWFLARPLWAQVVTILQYNLVFERSCLCSSLTPIYYHVGFYEKKILEYAKFA